MSKIVNNVVSCPRCQKLIQYNDSDKKGDYESTPFGTIHWEYIVCPEYGYKIQF